MRFTFALMIATASTTALAGPSSKTLERAIKLYAKQDFMSAHVELAKVISGDSGDDPESVQRAEFFVGKTLYQLGYYVASNAFFDRISSQGTSHRYYSAALKWYTALADVLPIQIDAFSKYSATDSDDPSLSSVKDQVKYRRAILAIGKSDFAAAAKELSAIDAGSKVYTKAQLALGFVQVRTTKIPEALATFATIKRGDDTGDLAALASGQLEARRKGWDQAIAAFAKVRATGPLGARAAWDGSWAKLEKSAKAPASLLPFSVTPIVDVDAPSAALLPTVIAFDYCPKQAATIDALAGFRADAVAIKKQLAALTAHDDNADFYVQLKAPKGLSPRVQALVKAALAGPVPTRGRAQSLEATVKRRRGVKRLAPVQVD